MIGHLLSPPGRIALGLLAAFMAYKGIQSTGVKKERVRVEKQDQTNVRKADAAARRSRDPHAAGVLDPYQRHD